MLLYDITMATKTVNQSTVKPVLRGHPWEIAK